MKTQQALLDLYVYILFGRILYPDRWALYLYFILVAEPDTLNPKIFSWLPNKHLTFTFIWQWYRVIQLYNNSNSFKAKRFEKNELYKIMKYPSIFCITEFKSKFGI